MTPLPAHLKPSELGTKEYWDSAYATELVNHSTSAAADANDEDDEGTIWFSDANAEDKVLEYLDALLDSQDGTDPSRDIGSLTGPGGNQCTRRPLSKSTTTYLDLGTGNGHMLFALREAGWAGRLVGVDYSANSIELCEQILQRRRDTAKTASFAETEAEPPDSGDANALHDTKMDRGDDDDDQDGHFDLSDIHFSQYDILSPSNPPPSSFPPSGFDIVLDKGTFDAISLSATPPQNNADTNQQGDTSEPQHVHPAERYASSVAPLIASGGLLIVTSCNWTAQEIRTWFERADDSVHANMPATLLRYVDQIKYPSFVFGGRSGSKVCSVCFVKA